MNIVVIGSGERASLLSDAFEKCGSKIIGRYILWGGPGDDTWRDLLSDRPAAVAVAGDDDTNNKVFQACMELQIGCFVSGRLSAAKLPLEAPTYTDNVPLWEPMYRDMRRATKDLPARRLMTVRSGPSIDVQESAVCALTMARDLDVARLGSRSPNLVVTKVAHIGPKTYIVTGTMGETFIELAYGRTLDPHLYAIAGKEKGHRRAPLSAKEWKLNDDEVAYREKDGMVELQSASGTPIKSPRPNHLVPCIERFLWDVEAKRVDPYLIELSIAAEADYRTILKELVHQGMTAEVFR